VPKEKRGAYEADHHRGSAAPVDRLLHQAGGHRQLGTALASGGNTFTSDDDPELVEAAIPFGLKLYESLLAESPKHTGLLLAAAQGFTEYSYAFVDSRIDEARAESLERADALRERARKLYIRAYHYGMRGLDARHPGFAAALDNDADLALRRGCQARRSIALLDCGLPGAHDFPFQNQPRAHRGAAVGGDHCASRSRSWMRTSTPARYLSS